VLQAPPPPPEEETSEGGDAYTAMRAGAERQAGRATPVYFDNGQLMLFRPECTFNARGNGKEEIFQLVFAMMAEKRLGWLSEEQSRVLGIPFLYALAELLWEITDQWTTLSAMSAMPGEEWSGFENRRKLTHKKARELNLGKLEGLVQKLHEEILQTWWTQAATWGPEWPTFKLSVDLLVERLAKFVGARLKNKEQVYSQRSTVRPEPVRGKRYDFYPVIPAKIPSESVPIHFEKIARLLWRPATTSPGARVYTDILVYTCAMRVPARTSPRRRPAAARPLQCIRRLASPPGKAKPHGPDCPDGAAPVPAHSRYFGDGAPPPPRPPRDGLGSGASGSSAGPAGLALVRRVPRPRAERHGTGRSPIRRDPVPQSHQANSPRTAGTLRRFSGMNLVHLELA